MCLWPPLTRELQISPRANWHYHLSCTDTSPGHRLEMFMHQQSKKMRGLAIAVCTFTALLITILLFQQYKKSLPVLGSEGVDSVNPLLYIPPIGLGTWQIPKSKVRFQLLFNILQNTRRSIICWHKAKDGGGCESSYWGRVPTYWCGTHLWYVRVFLFT